MKKTLGQFYTVRVDYILEGFVIPAIVRRIVEPFVGRGDLIKWIKPNDVMIDAYDLEPKCDDIKQPNLTVTTQNTLLNPPNYTDAWVITNPPYLGRNKATDKVIFDKYNTNDLYKCFIHSLCEISAMGGILIIPAGFFFSPREMDTKCRDAFLTKYKINVIKYFEETVFPDTPTTVVAFDFELSRVPMIEQKIRWIKKPGQDDRDFVLKKENGWIVGGEIYKIAKNPKLKIRRHVLDQKIEDGEQLTELLLTALDSGKQDGRISLKYVENYVYPAKNTSRAYANIIFQHADGKKYDKVEQMRIAELFNIYIEEMRANTWSLFLPAFRESKEYARKRIPFDLAYLLVHRCTMLM